MTAEAFWWEEQQVAESSAVELRLGPLSLWLENQPGSWDVAWERGEEIDHMLRRDSDRCDAIPPGVSRTRYVLGSHTESARIRPVLMDRAVVVKAYEPVFIPSGEEITLFISSPVMLRVEVGEPQQPLTDVPVMQLSDTWFGPSTREGELCYATRTHARYSLADVPRRPHRAITPVHISNQADTPLPIESLSIPLPVLSLYGGADASLWTEMVTLERRSDSDLASLRVQKGPPQGAGTACLISEPHRQSVRGGLVRAFSFVFN